MALASTAHTQSSVTLNEITDVGLTFASNVNGSKQSALTAGNESGHRSGPKVFKTLGIQIL